MESVIGFYFLVFTVLCTLIVILIDLIPIMMDWIQRIKIGKYEDFPNWNKAITRKGAKWLIKTPKIKITDNTRFVVLDMIKRNYSSSSIQHWQEASLLLGLSEYLKYNSGETRINELNQFLEGKFDSNGQWVKKPNNVDGAILAYAILKLEHVQGDSYKLAIDDMWKLIKNQVGIDGTVMYRNSMPNYRYVDTIGFICPFLISYGIKYQKEECIELAVKQIKDYVQYGMLDAHFIPSHAYDCKTKTPLGLYGWGRGLGWFAIGLIDSWNELPKNHKYKSELETIVKKFAKATMKHQQVNGNWNWTIFRNESRADSSTTATLAWFLLNASKLDGISEGCLHAVEKSFLYLMSVTRRNGEVDFSQGDTKDIGVYSTLFTPLPFTQGFCMRVVNLYRRVYSNQHHKDNINDINNQGANFHENHRIYSNL